MGVYIKSMEMPKTCKECGIEDDYYYFCHLSKKDTDEVRITGRRKDCPLTEVKVPHGNLIDGDKLLKATVLNLDHLPYITIRDVKGMTAAIEAEGGD